MKRHGAGYVRDCGAMAEKVIADLLKNYQIPIQRAAPTTAMSHIAIQERLDGKVVDWMEHVTDEQYGGAGIREQGSGINN